MAETYYELLDVSPDATTEEIEDAYRERLKDTHPDVSDAADAEDQTKRLIEAKEVLTDEAERARYDRLGHDAYVDGESSAESQTSGQSSGQSQTSESASRQSRTATDDRSGTTATNSKSGTTATGRYRRRENTSTSNSARGSGSTRKTREGPVTDSSGTRRQQTQKPSWSQSEGDTSTESGAGERVYANRNQKPRFHPSRLYSSSESLLVLLAAFAFYPFLLWVTLFSPFGLLVSLTVGCCLFGLMVYLQSMPDVGIFVYGTWSILIPLFFTSVGVNLAHPIVLLAISVTVFPLILTLLTRLFVGP